MTSDDRFAPYTTGAAAPAAPQPGAAGAGSAGAPAPTAVAQSRFDDGFFAGPAQPAPSQFGSGQAAVPTQAGPAPAGSPAPATADAPPAPGTAVGSPFGPAPATVPAPAWAPAGPVPPTSAAPTPSGHQTAGGVRLLRRIGITLGVLVLLGGFGIGRFSALAGFFAGDMTAPATLSGLAEAADESSQSAARSIEADLERRNNGDAVAQLYTDGTLMLFFVGQRTRVDLDREFADAGIATFTKLGDNTCGSAPDGTSMCMRTSRSTTIGVGGNVAVEQASAALDEAWDAQ